MHYVFLKYPIPNILTCLFTGYLNIPYHYCSHTHTPHLAFKAFWSIRTASISTIIPFRLLLTKKVLFLTSIIIIISFNKLWNHSASRQILHSDVLPFTV